METEFRSLEDRISQFVDLCGRLRDDNRRLRQELADAVNANKLLAGRVEDARARLEALLERIPDDGA